METTQIVLFFLASLAVIITPGQDLLLVLSRAVTQGSRAGIITASGVSFGLLGHSLVAALGLGALLLASASLFIMVKCVGALYLFYLGIRLITGGSNRLDLSQTNGTRTRTLFLTGAFSNISNPHVTLFYLAFLPQFIPASTEKPALYLLILGLTFALLTFLVKGPIGYLAGISSSWLSSRPSVLTWINRVSGTMLIGLGIRLVLNKPS